mmetsp:Transcript_11374/g.21655  ORF Transcript_11374/g.21655 Transcript_11374/m.21655 type:complete len:294 (+) Transcript_11374:93-974(+)
MGFNKGMDLFVGGGLLAAGITIGVKLGYGVSASVLNKCNRVSSEVPQHTIKIHYKSTVHLVSKPPKYYRDLDKLVRLAFAIPSELAVTITYVDTFNDCITVKSDSDLEALRNYLNLQPAAQSAPPISLQVEVEALACPTTQQPMATSVYPELPGHSEDPVNSSSSSSAFASSDLAGWPYNDALSDSLQQQEVTEPSKLTNNLCSLDRYQPHVPASGAPTPQQPSITKGSTCVPCKATPQSSSSNVLLSCYCALLACNAFVLVWGLRRANRGSIVLPKDRGATVIFSRPAPNRR